MTRTRLRQLEQIRSSDVYDDRLNQHDNSESATEGQPGGSITTGEDVVSITVATKTIVVSGDMTDIGVNIEDQIVISSSANGNDGTFTITSISYSAPNTTVVVEETIPGTDEGAISGGAAFDVDPTKNLDRDLNHIRTQLRKLSDPDGYWYSDPTDLAVDTYCSQTDAAYTAGTSIDACFNYEAGEPYDLQVFLNGNLALPSTVSGGSVTVENDYQEVDQDDNLVESGDVGRRVIFNFDIVVGDILTFIVGNTGQ